MKLLIALLISISLYADFITNTTYTCPLSTENIQFRLVDKGSIIIFASAIGFEVDPNYYALVLANGLKTVVQVVPELNTLVINGENLQPFTISCNQ